MELNRQQRQAVEHAGGHVLVLAGAGTGKTLTIVGRAAWLLEEGADPRRILLLTFTRRAAKEMVARLRAEVGAGAEQVTAGTFHHFCLLTMRRMPRQFGVEDATVIDRDDQVQLMRMARAGFRRKGERFPQAGKIVSAASYARNTNMPVRDYLERYTDLDEEVLDRVVDCVAEYRRRKTESGYLDFDDILFRFARVLHQSPAVRGKVRGLYDHILVDEMQDTNPLQWLILDGLRDPAQLFCVGDDAQSIYAFRGADFRNVHSFTDRLPDSRVLRLERNYRSTQEVLDLANWLLAESPLEYGKHLEAARGEGIRPRLIDFGDPLDEAQWIAEDILQRRETGAAWSDQMVITRSAYASRQLEAAFVERKVPYRFIGGTQLFAAAHVKDLLCMIRAAVSHRDELAWMRYLTMWRGIGDVTAARVVDGLRERSGPDEAAEWLRGSWSRDERILEGLDLVAERSGDPERVVRACRDFLDPLMEARYSNWDSRSRDIDLLARLARGHRTIRGFLETYTMDPVSRTDARRLEEEDVVSLVTAHSAKGTEAPVVYLIRVEPNVYPHVRSLGDPDGEEEERRVLYVGMTRARDELIMTRSCCLGGRTVFWGAATAEHSRGGVAYFLHGLPDELVRREAGVRGDPDPGGETIVSWRDG
jgi:DNA helicase-2/ATP-dependent DNA helicase PcrA